MVEEVSSPKKKQIGLLTNFIIVYSARSWHKLSSISFSMANWRCQRSLFYLWCRFSAQRWGWNLKLSRLAVRVYRFCGGVGDKIEAREVGIDKCRQIVNHVPLKPWSAAARFRRHRPGYRELQAQVTHVGHLHIMHCLFRSLCKERLRTNNCTSLSSPTSAPPCRHI